ncbi:class I SAM-dependent methyltransferase [Desulfatirhabdium butyrativorans]|uniref:class I SAM-dependent methyltransferase n=1 Tax=Desulfatirhabdium butyrativorans TaxID=340467 RepID=UPI000688DCFC|nr:class I SAM-dependent methyltransferase [Desulfatirhabdium butyrativorans]
MIPFFEVIDPSGSNVSPECRLARDMGRPPGGVACVEAERNARLWANGVEAKRIGLIFDPHFWYSTELWNRWIEALDAEGSGFCGLDAPLGNQNPAWRGENGLFIPPYATLRQLEDAASQTIQNPLWIERTVTSALDAAVVVVDAAVLRNVPEELRIGELPRLWVEEAAPLRLFCRGWLHAFSAVAEEGARQDLLAMTDWRGRVLELGCGEGRMGRRCRELGNTVWWMGVDIDPVCLSRAEAHLDAVLCCNLDAGLPLAEDARFDRIVCADVLEHLKFPWRLLAELRRHIADDGQLIASFPNVGHWSAIEDLLAGRWDETPSGLFCVTHLRFGTKATWDRWLKTAGWEPIRWEEERFPMPEAWLRMLALSPVSWDKDALETLRYRVVAAAGTIHR